MPVDHRLIVMRVGDVENAVNEIRRLAAIPFEDLSIDQVYSLRYNIIVLVESLVSIAVHILSEEYGYRATSYSDAIEQLCRRLRVRCIEDLKALIKLRNLLVHRYWEINDKLIHENVRNDFRCVEELLERVNEVLMA